MSFNLSPNSLIITNLNLLTDRLFLHIVANNLTNDFNFLEKWVVRLHTLPLIVIFIVFRALIVLTALVLPHQPVVT